MQDWRVALTVITSWLRSEPLGDLCLGVWCSLVEGPFPESVAARSGIALTHRVADTLHGLGVDHAATAMSAAWQYQRFASYRIATFFLAEWPSLETRERLGFRAEERGANLRLVVPNDAGVFEGPEIHEGVRCVHPVQAHLGLRAHPERAAEAADQLRMKLVYAWRGDG